MTAILCNHCKRPNSVSATVCIWCRNPLSQPGTPLQRDYTTLEADYIEGIDRLDDPGPVRLMVSCDGIEVVELVPGSRSVEIPASSIIETRISRSHRTEGATRAPRWRIALVPLRFGTSRADNANEQRECILEVKYTTGGEERVALFKWLDGDGQTKTSKLKRTLEKIRHSEEGSTSPVDSN